MDKIFMVSKKVLHNADKVIFTAKMQNDRGENNFVVVEVSDDATDITIKISTPIILGYYPAVVINEEATEMPEDGDA